MTGDLKGKRVAILATDGFEQSELTKPLEALLRAGADCEVVSLHQGSIKGWENKDWGREVAVDRTVDEADANDYDGLVLPGGVMNPDHLRMDMGAVDFVRAFVDAGKPIGAICHGPWTLIEAGAVKGRTLTSWPSLKTDLLNAGGNWVDQEVCVDRGIVTSRRPDDIPAFNAKLIEELGEGIHRRQAQPLSWEEEPTMQANLGPNA